MNCIILGLVPPCLDFWQELQTHVTSIPKDESDDKDEASIEWIESCTAADADNADDNDHGTLTLLVSAWTTTTASPQHVCEVVKSHLLTTTTTVGCLPQLLSCEIWACAPAPLPLRPTNGYPVHYNSDKATQQNGSSTTATTHPSAIMQEWGIVIQSNVVKTHGLSVIDQIVHDAIAKTEATLQVNHPNLCIGVDNILFREIASRNLQRFDLRLQGEHAMAFVQDYILSQSFVSSFLQETLGCAPEQINFDVSVVYSKPGACIQNWHADGAHHKGAPDAGWTRDGWCTHLAAPYAICLFVPLIDLNSHVGYTQFWPASHRYRNLVGFGPVSALVGATVDDGMNCRAGDGIWYDYRLLHRGMPNTSTDTLRPILQVVFKKKWYVERANYGATSMLEAEAETMPHGTEHSCDA